MNKHDVQKATELLREKADFNKLAAKMRVPEFRKIIVK